LHLLTRSFRASTLLVCLVLTAVTLTPYWQVKNHDFVNYDDDLYVSENRLVLKGLSLEGIRQVFEEPLLGFWHPLTMLSHMLDCQLFGPDPGSHHLVSLLLHTFNTLLLFLVLRGMTGAPWQSAFVAALFAVHPFHVESVAWISGRKDVLSTSFWFLTMLAYGRYVRRPGLQGYALVQLFFLLGLMAKPMLVTLPFVLLLMDYWPLGRMEGARRRGSGDFHLLFLEKVPLVILSVAASALALWAEEKMGAITSLDHLPFRDRIGNAPVSYATYVVKTFWPRGLAVYYPYPQSLPLWKVAAAALMLVLVTAGTVRLIRKHPYLIVGWGWFLGTLVPVIGLVQVGSHAMADRYTYIPLIGLFIMIAWGFQEVLNRHRYGTPALAVSAGAVLAVLAALTWSQVGHWKNSATLFDLAVKVTSNSDLGHYNLGLALQREGRIEEASVHYGEALRIRPDYPEAHANLGVILAKQGHLDLATAHFTEALRIDPDHAEGHNNMGLALSLQGRLDEAILHYVRALEGKPFFAEAHFNLAVALAGSGRRGAASAHFRRTLQIRPESPDAHNGLGVVLARQGRMREAAAHFKEALRIEPQHTEALKNLRLALREVRR